MARPQQNVGRDHSAARHRVRRRRRTAVARCGARHCQARFTELRHAAARNQPRRSRHFRYSCKSCRAASRRRSWAKVTRFERATSRRTYCGSASEVLAARTALEDLIKRLKLAPRKTLELERELEDFGRRIDRALRHERGEASASSDASSSSDVSLDGQHTSDSS